MNPFMPSGLTLWTGPFPVERDVWFLFFPCFIEILVFNAKSVDPDQTLLWHLIGVILFANAPFKGVRHK